MEAGMPTEEEIDGAISDLGRYPTNYGYHPTERKPAPHRIVVNSLEYCTYKQKVENVIRLLERMRGA